MYNKPEIKEYNYKKNFFYFLNILLISYPVFYPAVEIFGHVGQYLLFGIWFIFVSLSRKEFPILIIKQTFLYIFFMVYLIIKILLSINEIEYGFFSPIRLLSQFSLMYVYYIFSLWHQTYSNKSIKKKMMKAFILSLIISVLISIYYLSIDEYAIRGSLGINYFAVGDYNLVFTSLITSVFIWLLFITHKKLNGMLFIVWTLTTVLVFNANYTIALVTLFIIYIFSFILKPTDRRKKTFFILLSLFLCLFILPVMDNIIISVINNIINNREIPQVLSNRLIDIKNIFQSGEVINNGPLAARLNLTKTSIETFQGNLLSGVPFSNHGAHTVGGHTQWIDNLARFGIIGNLLLVSQFAIWLKKILNATDGKLNKTAIYISWLCFIIVGIFTTNMMAGLFISMFFIAPNLHLIQKDT